MAHSSHLHTDEMIMSWPVQNADPPELASLPFSKALLALNPILSVDMRSREIGREIRKLISPREGVEWRIPTTSCPPTVWHTPPIQKCPRAFPPPNYKMLSGVQDFLARIFSTPS